MSRVKKQMFLIIAALTVLLALSGCASEKAEPAAKPALSSGDITMENVSQVCEILKDAGLSHLEELKEWVKATKEGSESDADCRMTVMLLAGDLITSASTLESYTGDYLMFDTDRIENDPQYSMLKEKEPLFITMFGEMPFSDKGFSDSLAENWKNHGIKVNSETCSIISIIFKAYERDEAFVGHTGILINCGNNPSVGSKYVFVEKIAFGDPFRITLLNDEKELTEMLSKRPDYYTLEEGDPMPVVYRNGEKLGELTGINK